MSAHLSEEQQQRFSRSVWEAYYRGLSQNTPTHTKTPTPNTKLHQKIILSSSLSVLTVMEIMQNGDGDEDDKNDEINQKRFQVLSSTQFCMNLKQNFAQVVKKEMLFSRLLQNGANDKTSRKQGIRWSPNLHTRFVNALQQHGGSEGEMAIALAATSIIFKDDDSYSDKLLQCAASVCLQG
ncbi:hypothetical protein Tco_1396753, partial [Tanacetum coccineum]